MFSMINPLLPFISLFLLTVDSTNVSETVCLQQCECSRNNDNITASCSVGDFHELTKLVLHPENVTKLKVSSHLYTIQPLSFTRFTNLVLLNLSSNGITVVAKNAFLGLGKLEILDLSHNSLKYWDDNEISLQLLSLQTIYFTGNPTLTPSTNLLEVNSLKTILDTSWSEFCTECNLVKNLDKNKTDLYKQGNYGDYVVWHCRGTEYTVSKETQLFAKYGFYPECFGTDRKCKESQLRGTLSHRCYHSDNEILYLAYIIGFISIILNVTVVTVTLNSPLKNDVAMLLVSNLAFCDFLNEIYCICITMARHISPYTEFLTYLNGLCSVLGFLWTISQFGIIQTSVLLTFERYITIVFAMKPHLKPTPTMAKGFILGAWIIGIVAAILPLVGTMGSYVTNTYCIPLQPSKSAPGSYMYSVALALIGMLLYFLTIPLYIKIFTFVRKSSNQMGIKRDAKLAGRILMLVLTNMVFFLTPIVLALFWLLTDLFKRNITVQGRNILVGVFPLLCLSLNSFLNPLLYAYRNNRFRQALKFRLSRCLLKHTAVVDISMRSRSVGVTSKA